MNFDLNLKHLSYFIAVARLGSINKAAQTLYISQPYLGKIIKELENTAGTVLFERTRSGVILTPDGRDFLEHADTILREAKKLQRFSGSSDAPSHFLSVSMTRFSHIMESFIEIVLRHKDEPSFLHRLREGTAQEVVEDVYSGQFSVGVIHLDPKNRGQVSSHISSLGLSYSFLAHVRPHIILSANHPLIREGRPVTLRNLAPYGFARYQDAAEDYAYRIFSQNTQYNLNSGPKIVYLDGRASLMHLLSNSDFYSIGIHDFSAQSSTYQVISIPIEECTDCLEFGCILPRGGAVSGIAAEFLEELKSRLSEGITALWQTEGRAEHNR